MDRDLQEIASFLTERNGFTIIGHTIPDGDCIGSMLALYSPLRREPHEPCDGERQLRQGVLGRGLVPRAQLAAL